MASARSVPAHSALAHKLLFAALRQTFSILFLQDILRGAKDACHTLGPSVQWRVLPELTLTVTPAELDVIMQGLQQGPYSVVNGLIQKLLNQANSQCSASSSTDTSSAH